MWSFFLKNNRFGYLFLVALVGLGSYALISIPKESAPEVEVPVGIVTTILPGATASDVESLITNEVEKGLNSLSDVSKITSVSREGVSSVVVEFDASADIEKSIQDLKDKVDLVKSDLPSDAEDPSVFKVDFVDQPVLTVAVAGDLTDTMFTELAKEIKDEIESVSGVSKVDISGVRAREVTVIVDQASLALYGMQLQDVTNAIKSANLSFPIGQIKNNGVSYNVAFEGDITDVEQVANIGVTVRGGQPVFVRDIGRVVDGLAPSATLSRLSVDNQPSVNSITLNIYKQSGGDITVITGDVNAVLGGMQKEGGLLAGLDVSTVIDAGADIKKDLTRLSGSGLQTVILVVLLLVIAIGWREALLAGLAIPLSFLFGFIGLYFSGNTINFLSLFSLILGIGILVDSAIVMVEGINRKMKDEPTIDKKEAALSTIKEFSAPLISGTLTTVAMFAGLFIVSGIIGEFISSIPFTLIFILFASLFVSLAIIPLLAVIFLKRRSNTKFERIQVEKAHQLETWYKAKLNHIIGNKSAERKFLWGIRIALVLALLLPVIGLVKVVFFEQSDVDYLIVEIEQPEGTTKEITDIATRRVEEILYQEDNIDSFTVTVGSGNAFGNGGTGEKLANIFINLSKERELTSTELVEDLRAKFSDIRDFKVTVNQPSDGPPTGAAIVVKFLGDDLIEITDIANKSAQILSNIENVTNVKTSTNNNNTEFVIELDRAKAAAFGVNTLSASQILRAAVYGGTATAIKDLDDSIDVVVKLNVSSNPDVASDTTNVATMNDLLQLSIPTPAGDIPLASIATVGLRESSSVIDHEEGKRVVSVEADVTALGNAREIQTAAIAAINEQLSIPDSVVISTGGGETDDSNKAFIEMFMALVVGIALMVGILTLQFNSYLHMRYVLSILPYSLIGIMIGLAVTQNPLSFPSLMGFIALSGIVVNNSILLIDMMNQMRLKSPATDIRTIVIEASGNRLRPILLTTLTTVFGMIPLTYAGDLWAPLAYAVMFGLVFSVLITLILIPITYSRKPGEVN